MCLGIPGRIRSIDAHTDFGPTGLVDFDGVLMPVNLALVPEACVGDFVIVHVGFAITCLQEDEAARTLKLLEEVQRS